MYMIMKNATQPVWRYGVWVVRDADGAHVDHERYRHDLTERYPGLVLIGE